MKRIMPLLAGLFLMTALFATPALAQPPLPHAFFGAVEINGSPAPVGAQVEARGAGVRTGIDGNPITVTGAGKYGGPGGIDPKLIVQGDIADGAILTFYVNGVPTGLTAEWHSGEVTEINLSVTGEAPPPETTETPPPETTEPPPPGTTEPSPPGTTEPPPPETTEPPPPGTTEPPPPEITEPPPPGTTEPTPAPPAEPVNWPVLWGIIGGVVAVGLLIFFLARRRAY